MARRLAALWLVVGCALAYGHGDDPDPIAVIGRVDEGGATLAVRFQPAVFDVWLGLRRAVLHQLTPAETLEASAAAARFFGGSCPLRINRRRAAPAVLGVGMATARWRTFDVDVVEVRLRYAPPPGEPARRLDLRWDRFEAEGVELAGVHVSLEDDRRLQAHLLTPAEPEVAWHAPSPARRLRLAVRPPIPDRASPWLRSALALLLVAPLLLAGLWRLGGERPVLYALAALALLAAGGLVWRGLQLQTPPPPPLPAPAEAAQLARELTAGVYTAFQQRHEAGVYEALAEVSAGELLDRLYVEVRRGLIAPEHGNATSEVTGVEILEATPRLPPQGDRFAAHLRWRVHGEIRHAGHGHRRTLSCAADAVIRRTAQGWRLAELRLTQQQAVSEPGD